MIDALRNQHAIKALIGGDTGHHPIDIFIVFKMFVIAVGVLHMHQHQYAADQPQAEAEYLDGSKAGLLAQIS